METVRIALFPLELVLLPDELLPLHIFEERYKRLVARCLENAEPFGIVLRLSGGVAAVGCSARLVAVLERFPDGRSNIVVRGERPFRIEEIEVPEDADAEPMSGIVVFLEDGSDPRVAEQPPASDDVAEAEWVPDSLEGLIARLRAVRGGDPDAGDGDVAAGDEPGGAVADEHEEETGARGGGSGSPAGGPTAGARSYRIAVDLGLDVAQKQRLLESRSERERLIMVADHLETLVPRLELVESRREAIRGNGKGD